MVPRIAHRTPFAMSSFFDMLSAVFAWLMALAMLHFGAIDNPAREAAPPAAQGAQSHSESAVAHEPVAPPAPPADDDHDTRRHT